MTFEKKTARLSCGELSYWEAGQGEPLLCLHAAGGALLTDFLETLTGSRRVLIPVMPGFDGTSFAEHLDTVKDLAGVATEFIEKVIGEQVDVIGSSLGGWIAMWTAILNPQLIHLLVLEAPAGLRFGMDENSMTPEQMRANLFAYPERAAAIAPTPERARANAAALNHYAKTCFFVDEELAARVGEISVPTLVLLGMRDVTIPVETGRFLVSRIPQANLTYIYDAAHAVEVDQPDRMLRAVEPFLKRGPAFIVHKTEDKLPGRF